jgi:hypothetical protein
MTDIVNPGSGGTDKFSNLDSDKLEPTDSARNQIHLGGESSIIDIVAPGAAFLAARADGAAAGLAAQSFGSAATAPAFFAIRGRGTHDSPLASANGDTVLNLAGTGYTSSNQPGLFFGQIAGMNVVVQGTPGATTVPMSVELTNNEGSFLKSHQGRLVVVGSGSATPQERLNIQGRIELLAQASAPSGRTSYGKVWAKDDGYLYYTDPSGNHYNLITPDGEDYQPIYALEQRSTYALVGGGEWSNYDNDAFQLPDPGDFTDGGFDVRIDYVPLWGTRDPTSLEDDSFQELLSIESPTAWGGDLLEMAIVHRGKDAYQFVEFTSPDGTNPNGYGEDPTLFDFDYSTHYLHYTIVRYTHNPATGVTTVWRPIKFGETAEDTAHGLGWIASATNDKGGAYAIDTNDTNEPWKIGKGAGRFLIGRVIVNQYDGTPMADFDPDNATDELTVPDPVAGVDWTSSGSFAKIVNTSDIVNSLLGQTETQMSVTKDANGLKLVNDEASPGNSEYYGTNSSGTKGYYPLPEIWEATRGLGSDVTDTTTETSLLTSVVDLPALAAGEAVDFQATLEYINNSGTNRNPTWRFKIGSSTVLTLNQGNASASATSRFCTINGTIYAVGTNDVRLSASGFWQATSGGFAIISMAGSGTAAEAIQTAGLDFDISVQHPTNTSTQTARLLSLTMRKIKPS